MVSEVLYSGRLGTNKDKMWMTPGGRCAEQGGTEEAAVAGHRGVAIQNRSG